MTPKSKFEGYTRDGVRLYHFGGSDAPPAPDYTGAAKETSIGNLINARAQTKANRVNTFTPYGNLTYKNEQGFDQAGYDAALAKYKADSAARPAVTTQQAVANVDSEGNYADTAESLGLLPDGQPKAPTLPGLVEPKREDFMTGDPDQWTANIELSPAQQALLDQQNKTSLGLAGLQDSASGRVASALQTPFDMSQIPGRSGVGEMGRLFDTGSLPGRSALGPMGATFDPENLPDYLPMGRAYTERQDLARAYDPNRAPRLSSYYDPRQDTNTATQAILSRVAPQLQRDKAAMDTQLANQGIVQGSEAYRNAQDQFGRQANDAYTQAGLQGINLGMQQQGQNFGQSVQGINTGMSQQGQMFGQTLQNAGFRQGEQAQEFGQTNTNYQNSVGQRTQAAAEQAQKFGQEDRNYANSFNARGQSSAERAQSAQEQQQAYGQQNQNFLNTLNARQISDAERQAAIQEQAYLRSLPLNELNALRTGAQVSNPTFTNAPQQQYTPGPNLLDATNQMYGAQINGANAKNASAASNTQAAASIAAAALIFSDRRLKTNVVKVGEQDGYGIYEYDIFGRRERGVMAQEVMWIKPMAVHMHASGYLQVDYGSL